MEHLLLLYAAMTISAAIGFIYGAGKYLKPRKPLYASMIVIGVGCVMIGKAYSFLRVLTGLQVIGVFHVGILGTVGAFAFFFSANFGQIDSLVDGGEKQFAKYRVIGIAGVAAATLLYALILFSPASAAEKVSGGISALAVAGASYFHVKHIFIPDVDYGVVKCLRSYNTVAFFYGILCMLETAAASFGNDVMMYVVCGLECIASAALVPVMHKGVLKWNK